MDGSYFDLWTKRLWDGPRRRRDLLRLVLGGGGAAVALGTGADSALACRRTGKPCAKGKKNGDCCSGTCRKGTCRPTPGAAGCTVKTGDACRQQIVRCPNNPEGHCVLLDSGKPFCTATGVCQACRTSADCTDAPNGRCLRTCANCTETAGQGCAYQATAV